MIYILLPEPVDAWTNISGYNLIKEFYKDKERWGYTFQNYAFITRIFELNKAKKSKKRIIVTERSVLTDKYIFAKMLYEDGYINEMENKMYNKWFDNFRYNVDCVVYIKTDIDKCAERIKKRARDGEDIISKDYLISLEEKHEEWLAKNKKVLRLNGNLNFIDNIRVREDMFKQLKDFIINNE